MNPNTKAAVEQMLSNAKATKTSDKTNGRILTDYDRAYLDGMIKTLETLLELQGK